MMMVGLSFASTLQYEPKPIDQPIEQPMAVENIPGNYSIGQGLSVVIPPYEEVLRQCIEADILDKCLENGLRP